MTAGPGTFFPQAKFWLPRSYIRGIYFATYAGNTVTLSGDRFTVAAVPPDPTFLVCQIRPEFFPWNSNSYSLDFIVTEFWYKLGGVGPEIPHEFTVSYINDAPHNAQAIKIEWTILTPTFNYFEVPAAPNHYWRPPPLP